MFTNKELLLDINDFSCYANNQGITTGIEDVLCNAIWLISQKPGVPKGIRKGPL